MPRYDYPDAAAAVIAPITEEQLAQQLDRDGVRIRRFLGRFWRTRRGWWEPVHQLARLARDEIGRPGPGWGYRAVLDEDARGSSNATIPVHLLADVAGWSEDSLPRDARRSVRRAAAGGVRIVHVTDVRLLADQGHGVALDWSRRVGPPASTPERDGYVAAEERRLADGRLVLAALVDDRLVGYASAWAVGDVAYLHESKVATDDRRLGVTAALDLETLRAIRRQPEVGRASMGLHEPEWPTLTTFKSRIGFPVVQVPSFLWVAKPVELLIRARRPLAWYRLAGRMP
jgi:hypothetical protein